MQSWMPGKKMKEKSGSSLRRGFFESFNLGSGKANSTPVLLAVRKKMGISPSDSGNDDSLGSPILETKNRKSIDEPDCHALTGKHQKESHQRPTPVRSVSLQYPKKSSYDFPTAKWTSKNFLHHEKSSRKGQNGNHRQKHRGKSYTSSHIEIGSKESDNENTHNDNLANVTSEIERFEREFLYKNLSLKQDNYAKDVTNIQVDGNFVHDDVANEEDPIVPSPNNQVIHSSTNSVVSDSNYDSGAFSRTSSPEIAIPDHARDVQNDLPPLTSPSLVLNLMRGDSGDFIYDKSVDGSFVLACLDAAGKSSSFQTHLGLRGEPDGLDHLTTIQNTTTNVNLDELDSFTAKKCCSTTPILSSSSVSITIGATTKLSINSSTDSLTTSHPVNQNISVKSNHMSSLPNLASFRSESFRGSSESPVRDGRCLAKMGMSSLVTPQKPPRLNTPPRSMERNKISTVVLNNNPSISSQKHDSTPKHPSNLPNKTTVQIQSRKHFKKKAPFRKDQLEMCQVNEDELRLPRAASISSQDSSCDNSSGICTGGYSSGFTSSASYPTMGCASCGSQVTVNGKHHCVKDDCDEAVSTSF